MKLFRKLTLLTTLVLTLFVSVNLVNVEADSADTLVVHYYRFDEDYSGWNMWLWPFEPVGGDGQGYNFDGTDDYGAISTITLSNTNLVDSTTIGIIVRLNEWEAKDIGADRHIDMTNPNTEGEVHIWLIQDDPTIYYTAEDADTSDRVLTATFSDENTIEFTATADVEASDITFLEGTTELTISNFSFNNDKGSFDISTSIDLTNKYFLTVDFDGTGGEPFSVAFDGFYSSDLFNQQFGYDGELGAIYSDTETTFKIWAPISDNITLNLYTKGHKSTETDYQGNPGVDTAYETHALTLGQKGVWSVTVPGDLNGVYYTFSIDNGGLITEIVDPYAFTAGINGKRGMVIDFDLYDPTNWDSDTRPDTMDAYTDAIIYELHVRDLTSHSTWTGTEDYRGKFLGLVEEGTTYQGITTGFDHIKELGVTHVQLVPVFDHGIIDERRLNDPTYFGIKDGIFNWGYMPENFNVVEGSYSTDPYNGEVRVTEFKDMVQAFHSEDIRVIMDVVYNHTGKSADSNFDVILPGYYFRMNADGTFSNGSGTGNETASDRYMFQKYMIDSLVFWAEEYNIDGFRFDLMKLHDVETMQKVTAALHEIDPTIMIYGEPWTGGGSLLPESEAAYNANLDELPGVAVFNDDTRDGIKGSVFDSGDKGFVQGNNYADARVLLGVTGATLQDNLPTGSLPKGPWALEPTQSINYVTAHDNNTLHDKLILSARPELEDLIRMQRQANSIILTSQGIPFLHAGVEFLKSKPCVVIEGEAQGECDSANTFDHNSYRSPDGTNQFDYNDKVEHIETFEYYKNLIALRKMKDVFTLDTSADIADHLQLITDSESGFISYFLHDEEDYWQTTYIMHNNGDTSREMVLHPGTWNVIATTDEFGDLETIDYNGNSISNFTTIEVLEGGQLITLDTNETLIMYSTDLVTYQPDFQNVTPEPTPEPSGISPVVIIVVIAGVVVIAGGAIFLKRR